MATQPIPSTLPEFFWHFIRRHPVAFFLMAVLPLGWAVEINLFPYLTKMIIDIVTAYQGDRADIYQALATPLIWGMSVWILLVVIWRGLDVVEWYWEPHFQADIRMAVFDYTQRHSHRYFADNFAGSIANKISDISRSSWVVLILLLRHFSATTAAVLVSIAMLWTVHPVFSLIQLLFFLTHMAICLALARRCDELSHTHSEARTLLQGKIVDVISNILNVRLFARQPFERKYVGGFQADEFAKHRYLLAYMTKIRVLLEIPAFLMIVAILTGLIHGWQLGWIGAGDFAYVITLALSIMGAVWRMGWEFPNFFREVGVCQQALSLLSHPHGIVDKPDAMPLEIKEGRIEFDNVTFHYTPQRNIFRDKTIFIPAGQKVG